jgi:hypothetical protein
MPLLSCLLLLPTFALAGDGPVVTLTGTGIAPVETSEPTTVVSTLIDAGTDIEYCWSAAAGIQASPVASYRYGWDVVDPNDPFDPAWAIPVTAYDGSELCAPLQAFLTGTHQFVVIVTDEADVSTTVVVQVDINQAVPTLPRSTGMLKARY